MQWLIYLGVLENLASQASVAEKIGQDSNTMPWLLARIQKKERPVSQNQQYSAEILAILLQSGFKNRERFTELDGVDALLQLLSQYRKRDPEKDSDEAEYAENLFDCLACLVDDDAGKEKFLEGEGIELAQIMLKEPTQPNFVNSGYRSVCSERIDRLLISVSRSASEVMNL